MGRIVIACYRPKPGKEDALKALVVPIGQVAEASQMFSAFTPVAVNT